MEGLESLLNYSAQMVAARKKSNHSYKKDFDKIRCEELQAKQVGEMMSIKILIKQIKNHGKSN